MQSVYTIALAIGFLTVGHVNSSLRDLIPNGHISTLARATARIIHDEYNDELTTVHFIKWTLFNNDILEQMIYGFSPLASYAIEDGKQIRKWYPRRFNVFLIDGYSDVDIIGVRTYYNKFDPNGVYIIAMRNMDNQLKTILQIFNIFFKSFFVNVNVLVEEANGTTSMYTYFPCRPTHCYEVAPVLYNSFNGNEFEKRIVHFPKKFKNFHGCPMTAAVFPMPPYILINSMEDHTWTIDGIDGRLLQLIAGRLNFTLKVNNSLNRGTIYPNGRATGTIGLLSSGPGNLTAGGIESHQVHLTFLSPTPSYLYTETVFALPIPDEYTSIERLVLPFTTTVWVWKFSFFVYAFIAMGIVQKCPAKYRRFIIGEGTYTPILQMYQITTGMGAPKTPKRSSARILFGSWLLTNLILNSTYCGKLIEFMSSKMHKPSPQTIDDLMKLNYDFYIPTHLLLTVRGLYRNYTSSKFHEMSGSSEDYLKLLHVPKARLAVMQTKLNIDYFNARHHKNGVLPLLRERFRSIPLSILFKKNSYFVKPFEEIINDISQSGLTEKLVRDVIDEKGFKATRKYHGMERLTLSHYDGCFKACSLLLMGSVVMLVLELLSVRWIVARKIVCFLTKS